MEITGVLLQARAARGTNAERSDFLGESLADSMEFNWAGRETADWAEVVLLDARFSLVNLRLDE